MDKNHFGQKEDWSLLGKQDEFLKVFVMKKLVSVPLLLFFHELLPSGH